MQSALRSTVARVRLALMPLLSLAALWGCSGRPDESPPPAADYAVTPRPSTRTSSAAPAAPCEDWSTVECGIELRTHGGLVDCARGVRLCQAGTYGACVPDASRGVVSVQAPDEVLPASILTGTMSVGGVSATCADDPCNPFCQRYLDTPPTPYDAPRVDTATGSLSGGALQDSNLPSSFKNKGSLDAQCASAAGSDPYNEACQFDQHCVAGACQAYKAGESGSCTGVDITAPTTCVPSSGGTRALTVCNRGTAAAAAGIRCYAYPGGSPQYPNDDPGTTTRLLMTTANVLGPGECETQQIDEAIFHQNGIQSVACNPPQTATTTATLTSYPNSNFTTSGALPWVNPDRAYASDNSDATATPANPGGASTGSSYPSANSTFATDAAWTNAANAYSASPAGSYANVSPAAPSGGSGTIGPSYPGGFDNPSATGDTAFSNPDRIYSADGSYLSAAPANPTTVTTVTKVPSANDAAAAWSNPSRTYASDSSYATALRSSAGTSDLVLSGFGFSLPSNAVLDELDISIKWVTDVNSTKYSLTAQAITGSGNTLMGSALTKASPYTTETTDTAAISAASLSGFGASAFSDANFKLRVRFVRSSGNVTASTAKVDFVQVAVKYHLTSTTASVDYRYFGLGSIPANATVQLTAEVKWKTSAVNSNLTLGMQLYKNWGSASQSTIGSEVTRTPAAANTDYVDGTGTLTPSPADLIDTSFAIRLRATRASGATNPDFTASIDYVRVNVTWSLAGASTTSSIFLTGFGLDQLIPSNATITSVVTSASWKLSTSGTAGTLGVQAYKAAGATALGTEITDATSPTALTTATQTVSSGVAITDLSDTNFGVRVRVSRAASASAPAFTAYLDEVHVLVNWTSPSVEHGVTYGNFGIASQLEPSVSITAIKTEARWKNSASNRHAELAFQLFSAGVALGAELVDSSPSTSMTTQTQTLTGLSLTRSDLNNANFVVKVRSTRTTGSSNTDYTSDLDFLRVTVTYSTTTDLAVAECNGSNNWTATKLVPTPDACEDMSTPQYVPFTVTRVFQGVCGSSQKPTWRRFGYTSSTPGATSIQFRFRSFSPAPDGSCTALPAVTSGSPVPLATASIAGNSQMCGTTDLRCVLDLNGYLGGLPGAGNLCLQMDAYGVPETSNTPQLQDWTILYDCTDAE